MQFQRFFWLPVLALAVTTSGTAATAFNSPTKTLRHWPLPTSPLNHKATVANTGAATKQSQSGTATILEEDGVLEEGDSVLTSDQSLYDAYTFVGHPGQQISISLSSNDFATYLLLIGPDGETVAEDYDTNESSSNSSVQTTLPSSGVYTILANSVDATGRGSYQVLATTTLGTGDIQATLRWNSTDDLDLMVVDPNGDIVSFDNTPVTSGGRLDVDANSICQDNVSSTPVENIFWPEGDAPKGDYQVVVSLYQRCGEESQGPISFSLTLNVQGSTEVLQGTVDESTQYVTFPTALY